MSEKIYIVKMVKGVIKAMLRSMGESKLSLNKIITVNLEIANLVNERPIGIKPNTNKISLLS